MLIIERTLWFLNSAITIAIVVVIALMVIRLIADAMDLNPFAWMSRTVRRLTDWIVMPMRGGLRGFGIDPKLAPLVAILIAILLGYFLIWLTGTIAGTFAGVIESLRRADIPMLLGTIIYGLLSIYLLFIVVRVIFSWGGVGYTNRVMRFLIDATEPLLGPLRRMNLRVGWLDLSPMVAMLIIILFQGAVRGTLLRGVTIMGF